MALALADSIASADWDLGDQLNRNVAWWQHVTYSVNGVCFDIGMTTRFALAAFLRQRDPMTCTPSDERSSGNGSIMRLAPVPIAFHDWLDENFDGLVRRAEESSVTTHASNQCRAACRYLTAVLAALIRGEDRNAVLSLDSKLLGCLENVAPLDPAVVGVARGSYRHKAPPEIHGSGYRSEHPGQRGTI